MCKLYSGKPCTGLHLKSFCYTRYIIITHVGIIVDIKNHVAKLKFITDRENIFIDN